MIDWRGRLWDPRSRRGLYRLVFVLLAPLEWGYRLAVAARNWAYGSGLLRAERPAIPTLAVGNLTVGGTGKTPLTASLAAELRARGRRPAVVTRGYGGDEVVVHRILNPELGIVVSANRRAGVRRALERGADFAVLDDAFQHRRLRAHAYLVLVAAEESTVERRLLPRGPWREPIGALTRADLVVVTRKEASREAADAVRARLAERWPHLPSAQVHLCLEWLHRFDADGTLEPARVALAGFQAPLGVAGVARPDSMWRQLERGGARVEERWSFSDHHRYDEGDVERIVARAGGGPVVLTLKDAVKLRRVIPEDIVTYVPLQEVVWEEGADRLESLLAELVGGGTGREDTR